jgi:hypothetical protein
VLDLPFWREDGEWFVLTPNQVRERPDEHVEQWARMLRADLDAPVHITERHGRLVIIDSVHRLLKANILGRDCLPARRVPGSVLPLIAAGLTEDPGLLRLVLLLGQDGPSRGGRRGARSAA